MKALIIGSAAALALTFLAAPAFAASFYVVQDSASKKCSIVETAPTVATSAVIGDKAGYKTHAEANTAMGKDSVCVTK